MSKLSPLRVDNLNFNVQLCATPTLEATSRMRRYLGLLGLRAGRSISRPTTRKAPKAWLMCRRTDEYDVYDVNGAVGLIEYRVESVLKPCPFVGEESPSISEWSARCTGPRVM